MSKNFIGVLLLGFITLLIGCNDTKTSSSQAADVTGAAADVTGAAPDALSADFEYGWPNMVDKLGKELADYDCSELENNTFRVGLGDWNPHTFQTHTGKFAGALADSLKVLRLMTKADIRVVRDKYWMKGVVGIANDEYDIVPAWSISHGEFHSDKFPNGLFNNGDPYDMQQQVSSKRVVFIHNTGANAVYELFKDTTDMDERFRVLAAAGYIGIGQPSWGNWARAMSLKDDSGQAIFQEGVNFFNTQDCEDLAGGSNAKYVWKGIDEQTICAGRLAETGVAFDQTKFFTVEIPNEYNIDKSASYNNTAILTVDGEENSENAYVASVYWTWFARPDIPTCMKNALQTLSDAGIIFAFARTWNKTNYKGFEYHGISWQETNLFNSHKEFDPEGEKIQDIWSPHLDFWEYIAQNSISEGSFFLNFDHWENDSDPADRLTGPYLTSYWEHWTSRLNNKVKLVYQ